MMLIFDRVTYDGFNATQKALLRWCPLSLQLGQPVVMTVNTTDYYLFDDVRMGLNDLAITTVIMSQISSLSNHSNSAEGDPLRADIQSIIAATIVWPASISYTVSGDVYAQTIAAQVNPPTALHAVSGSSLEANNIFNPD